MLPHALIHHFFAVLHPLSIRPARRIGRRRRRMQEERLHLHAFERPGVTSERIRLYAQSLQNRHEQMRQR